MNRRAAAGMIVLAVLAASADSAEPRREDAPTGALELDSTAITGNRELPKVMVVVPWKQAQPAMPAGRPMNSLVEKLLTPVDRDVFRRELAYHNAARQRADDAAMNKQIETKDRKSEE